MLLLVILLDATQFRPVQVPLKKRPPLFQVHCSDKTQGTGVTAEENCYDFLELVVNKYGTVFW